MGSSPIVSTGFRASEPDRPLQSHYIGRVPGSKRERRPGVWELKVSVGRDPVSGQPRSVTRTFKGTESKAAKALAALVTDVDRGHHRATSTSTVAALVTRYLEDRAPRLSPATMDVYRSSTKRLETTQLWGQRLSKVTPFDVDAAFAGLLERGASVHVRSQCFRLLNSAFRQGVRWRQISYNPCSDAQSPRPPRVSVTAPAVE